VAMPSHAASDHGSVEDVERCKQSGRAVAVVFGIRLPRADAWDCHEPAARSAIDRYLNFAYSEILACAVEMRRCLFGLRPGSGTQYWPSRSRRRFDAFLLRLSGTPVFKKLARGEFQRTNNI
jgi:hypothetical protein